MSDLVERVARAMWQLACDRANADERREGRVPPLKWADPWHPSGTGIRQQSLYREEAERALRAIQESGTHKIMPVEPTPENASAMQGYRAMLSAAPDVLGEKP